MTNGIDEQGRAVDNSRLGFKVVQLGGEGNPPWALDYTDVDDHGRTRHRFVAEGLRGTDYDSAVIIASLLSNDAKIGELERALARLREENEQLNADIQDLRLSAIGGPMQRRTAALSVQPGGEIPRKTPVPRLAVRNGALASHRRGYRVWARPSRSGGRGRRAGHDDAPGCGVTTRPGRLLDPIAPVQEGYGCQRHCSARTWDFTGPEIAVAHRVSGDAD